MAIVTSCEFFDFLPRSVPEKVVPGDNSHADISFPGDDKMPEVHPPEEFVNPPDGGARRNGVGVTIYQA